MNVMRTISHELRHHVPFTIFGAVVGIVLAFVFVYTAVPRSISAGLFWSLHPAHVFFSALATAAMYRLHSRGNWIATIVIGYVGAIAIGTLSDSLMPFLGELLLGLGDEHVHAEAHIGLIEMWWLVNPLAVLGTLLALVWPKTTIPHTGHVLLSTGASLFHVLMSLHAGVSPVTVALVPVVLFLAVWVPCCTSDIVFPLLLIPEPTERQDPHGHAHHDHEQ